VGEQDDGIGAGPDIITVVVLTSYVAASPDHHVPPWEKRPRQTSDCDASVALVRHRYRLRQMRAPELSLTFTIITSTINSSRLIDRLLLLYACQRSAGRKQ